MDPPPFSGGPTSTTAAVPPSGNVNYADSANSSPRSRHTESWDEQPPHAATAGGKLRLMCSYGGHIIPRPHDKSLCYVGGETRIFAVDRNTSLADLSVKLSKTLLGGHPFCLKYQLQNEDLDSLISVTSDEDLENMIDEYDRMNMNMNNSSSSKVARLRLFLFPSKTETTEIVRESLIKSKTIEMVRESLTKSDDWFVNVLNGASSATVLSETSSVNYLLGLDDDVENVKNDVEGQLEVKNGENSVKVSAQDVIQSVPDSPMVETTSSFGSMSSMNLPPIKVHVEENQKGGTFEEQFSQMTLGIVTQKPEEGAFAGLSSPPAPPVLVPATVVSGVQLQQIQLPPQLQPKLVVPSDLPSPDSVSSESSVTNPLSRQMHYLYQEPGVQFQSGSGRISGNSVDPKMSDSIGRAQVKQQVLDSGYALPVQYDHQQQMHQPQQFVHMGQYMQHTPSGPVPMASYYPMYPSQHQTHPQQHPALEHQYPVYFIPARPSQGYSLPLQQTNYTEPAQTALSARPQTPPTMVNPTAAYNPARNPPTTKPEMVAGPYRTVSAGAAAPQIVQITSGQHQPQYMAYSQIHHPSQSVPPTSATTASYAYDFADPTHTKMYYTQPLAPQLAAQYQTMTSAPAVSFTETSSQFPVENLKQQLRTSQA
ncbi:uncharacterized protein LOC107821193 [Nicotiana tabacum]|uniref:Uncharacterized protein LOC107821193 n=2 Tax=Nicotiana TaxID=4085 RepID=A0A1S4CPX1_TOBAC|nr:PREDICTED: uncharacterized protein LOC104243320 [Nicotiana sylvestris]XP_016503101.1 PREDICTED: uncharacterized protein LOC107821193 [Nicotiana tabacum]